MNLPMQSSLLPTLLACASITPFAAAQGGGPTPTPLLDGFEDGVNQGGWAYNPSDVLERAGGNPGGWWHQDFAFTYAPVIYSASPALAGDWRAAGADRVQFDARLDHLDFGTGEGFPMSLLLRDTKGTADMQDDDFAYTVGPNVPLVGTGWKSFDFPVPSADTSPLPSGWIGGYSGDPEHFRPGVDWNDVITSIDRVGIYWFNPATAAIYQVWDVGLDNVQVSANGSATARNGGGTNPAGFASTSAPTLGATWTSTVDVATPGHPLSAVAVSFGGPTQGVFPGGAIVGELLVLPPFVVDVQAGSHALPVPPTPGLLGALIATQGATVSSAGSIHLNNALDLVLGL
jgi:hypothetical protein